MSRQKNTVRLDEQTTLNYVLDVGRRKRMSLTFVGDELVVRVPYGCTQAQINELILSNTNWILKNRQRRTEHIGLPVTYEQGEKIRLLGKVYEIVFVNSDRFFEPYLDGEHLITAVCDDYNASFVKDRIDSFIAKLAAETISGRMEIACALVGLHPQKLTLRKMSTRWGSCSANGNISLNLNMIQFPVECIDYVCIHELCHLKHMDHSKDFWEMVACFCPQWKKLRETMKY